MQTARGNQDRSRNDVDERGGGYDRETLSHLRGGSDRDGLFGGRGGGLEEDYRFGGGGISRSRPFQGRGSFDTQVDLRQQFAVIERLRDIEQERIELLTMLGVNVGGREFYGRENFDPRGEPQGRNPNDRDFTQRAQPQSRGLGLRGISMKNVQREDSQVKDEVIRLLTEHDDIDPTEIDVKVKDGVITLTGTVEDRHAKLLIEHLTGNVIGVKDVENQIRVSPQQQQPRGEGGSNATGRQSTKEQRPHAS